MPEPTRAACRPCPLPRADWGARLTSTFPDSLAQAANKTALTALGCYDITKPHVPTQLALPMMCLDDSTGARSCVGCGWQPAAGQRGRGSDTVP